MPRLMRPLLLAVGVGAVAVIAVVAFARSDGSRAAARSAPKHDVDVTSRPRSASQHRAVVTARPGRELSADRLATILSHEAANVTADDGTVQMAVMLDSWSEPVVVGEDLHSQMRLWSLSKPLVALTLLRTAGPQASELANGLSLYLDRSLQRSDNCAQRYLTIRLQDAVGGIPQAEDALSHTLALSGASADVGLSQTDTLGATCVTSSYQGLPTSYVARRALLVGTATWTISDAIRFIHGLSSDATANDASAAASKIILATMRRPKLAGIEPGASILTAPPDWGAGQAFSGHCWNLAYKAGWGGADAHIPWVGSQVGVVSLPDHQSLAFAVAVHPYRQPPNDDPGLTTVPAGITTMLSALRGELTQRYPRWCAA